jgi:hypothetical protein
MKGEKEGRNIRESVGRSGDGEAMDGQHWCGGRRRSRFLAKVIANPVSEGD